jgi:hypothetical protein
VGSQSLTGRFSANVTSARDAIPSFPSFEEFFTKIHSTVNSVDLSSIKELFDTVLQKPSPEVAEYGLAIFSLFYRILRLESVTDLFFAALDFFKSIFGAQFIIECAQALYKFLLDGVSTVYNQLILSTARSTLEVESKAIDTLNDFRRQLSSVLSGEVVTVVRDFILSLVSWKVFSRDATRTITSALGPAKACSGLELFELTLSTAVTMFTCSERLASGESLGEILGAKDPASAFNGLADELVSLKDFTYSGLPVEGKVCRVEYVARLERAIASGKTVEESLPKRAPTRSIVSNNIRKLRAIHNELYSIMVAQVRPTPMAVCLEGMPGVGKGLLVDVLGMIWSDVKGREYDSSHVYHRQALEEYWSGYQPASNPIIHYSEPGSLHRKIAESRGDPVMNEILSVIDNQPYMCSMAEVENKGKVFVMPELVLMDCNDPTMNIDVVVNNPAAVKRRMLYIRPTVKPEFRKSGTCRMDQVRSLSSNIPILDRWTFDVYRMEPVDLKTSGVTRLIEGTDIYGLTKLLNTNFHEHISQQEERVAMVSKINIRDYLRSEAGEVGGQIAPPVITPVVYPWYALLAAEVGIEVTWSFLFLLYFLFLQVLCYFGMIVSFLWPQNIFLKLFTVRAAQRRANYYGEKVLYWYHQTQLSCGVDVVLPAKEPPRFDYVPYVMIFSGLVLCFKIFRVSTLFTEGNVLSSMAERTPEEVDEVIDSVEESTACEIPPPRTKAGNGIDWDSVERPKPVLITEPVQYNEPDKIAAAVQKNVRVLFISGEKTFETRAVGIFGDFALVNRHSFSHARSDGTWSVEVRVDPEVDIGIRNVLIRHTEMEQVDGDVWLVRLRGAKFRDIRSYIAAEIVSPPIFGAKGIIGGEYVRVKRATPVVAQDKNWGPVPVEHPMRYAWSNHAVGMCGSPLCMEYSGGFGFVGIHIAGHTGHNDSYSEAISMRQIAPAARTLMNKSVTLGVNSEGRLRLPVYSPGLGDVCARSPLRFESVPGLDVYGSILGYSPQRLGKSKLVTSGFLPYAEKLTGISPFDAEGKPLFAPPPFRSRTFEGEYVAPYNHFVKKAGVIKKSLDPSILNRTIKLVTHRIVTGLATKGVTSLSPVPLSVAQNGHPEDFYMRAMKPSTSGGWAWPGAKKKYSEQCELDFKKDSYMPLYDVKEQVVEQLNAYTRGEDALPLLGAQLKDEPRAYKKVLQAKTRVFCMSPYESTLVNRMYLMPFYSLMVQFGDVFCTAIGINMHSTDVDEFVNTLVEFSKSLMEGDYGGYDTSMPFDIGLAANTVVYEVLKHLGYNDEALEKVKGILSDNLFPTVVMQGDVFTIPALQPSGKYATAEDNSLRGLIMLVYAWIAMTLKNDDFEDLDFFRLVKPRIYGDDMLAAVKYKAQHIFNNCTYQRFCEEVYGIEFTNALKTKDMQPFLRPDQISFLKRKFVYRDDLGHFVAQLDRASIMKSIVYYLPSKSVSVEEQLVDSCVSALRELFFWETEPNYEILRHEFASVAAEVLDLEMEDILKVFPRFDSIREQVYPAPDVESALVKESTPINVQLRELFGIPSGNYLTMLHPLITESAEIVNPMQALLQQAQEAAQHNSSRRAVQAKQVESVGPCAVLKRFYDNFCAQTYELCCFAAGFVSDISGPTVTTPSERIAEFEQNCATLKDEVCSKNFLIALVKFPILLVPSFFLTLLPTGWYLQMCKLFGCTHAYTIGATLLSTVIGSPIAEEFFHKDTFAEAIVFSCFEFYIKGCPLIGFPAFAMHILLWQRNRMDRAKLHSRFNFVVVLLENWYNGTLLNLQEIP